MTTRFRVARIVTASALAVAGLGITVAAGPASAEGVRVKDPADATVSLSDIRRVTVRHTPARVYVTARVTDLRRTSEAGPAGLGFYLDTGGSRAPDYQLSTGLQNGTDYALTSVDDWGSAGSDPLTCRHQLRLDFKHDVVRGWIARRCLGTPESVRVAVKMVDSYDGSHPVKDWLRAPRTYTRWLEAS